MKKTTRKLTVRRETLRNLLGNELDRVAGGSETRAWSNCNYGCQNGSNNCGTGAESMQGNCHVLNKVLTP